MNRKSVQAQARQEAGSAYLRQRRVAASKCLYVINAMPV